MWWAAGPGRNGRWHPEPFHRLLGMAHEEASRSGDIGSACEPHQPDGQVAQRSHHVWGGLLAHLGTIFVVGAVANIMEAVFDRPVAAIEGEQRVRIGLVGAQAGDGEHDLALLGVVLEAHPHTFDAGDLRDVWEVEGRGELAAHPDGSGFQAAMSLIGGL